MRKAKPATKRHLSAESRASIEFNSRICKEVLGDECRRIHEVIEGNLVRPKHKPRKRQDDVD